MGLLRSILALPGDLRWRLSLSRQKWTAPAGEPVIGFGGAGPNSTAFVHGGRVKLIHLARRFAYSDDRFNLLYMVSSVPPDHASTLAKWARQRGARIVWNQNGVGFPAWARGQTAAVNRPMRALLHQADFVVYQSAFCRESADRFLGQPQCLTEVLPNPVDLTEFSPAPEPPDLSVWQLLAAGTHHQPFRVLGAIETLRLLHRAGRPARLLIAGELRWKNARAEVHQAIAAAGLSDLVEVRPRFSQGQAVTMLRAAHILLHAKYHDPCPTMVIEALACGVPVIGSRTGGMEELVGNKAGALIEVPVSWERPAYPAPEELAAAVERVMSDWPARSQAARTRAEQLFAAEQWLDRHEAIFRQLLDQR